MVGGGKLRLKIENEPNGIWNSVNFIAGVDFYLDYITK